jgi:CMP-N-acetylneuraminic acid synthetase/spore coat polysaccharide biosynthesis predicted glycosyltransferase SpsG
MQPNILIIIPARGGSKGIPRKNLRALAGKPLIYYSIQTARGLRFQPDVYVSTDDSEIATIAEKLGASIIHRDAAKAQDHTTLDPVIFDGYQQAREKEGKDYDLIVTLQPTSPLLKSGSLDTALERMLGEPTIDTIISARDDTHLTWRREEGRYVPNYAKRVNRQYLEPVFKETGGFLITRSSIISENNRIGPRVELHLLQGGEDIDIDTYEDWSLCEYYLKRRKILFVVSGYQQIGLGHVYNTLLIANDILNHQVEFLVDDKSQLAYDKIASKNYRVHMQSQADIVEDIRRLAPDVVINDRLDTGEAYMAALKDSGISTINFEDLGPGARLADLVINAIYPEREVLPRHYFGHEYFILRDEFVLTPVRPPAEQVRRVLLTFGGVDPNNYTRKVIEAIHPYCRQHGIELWVVAGFGYSQYETLEPYADVQVFRNSMTIAEHMSAADIIFTSAGRTTYEVAALQVPAIVLAQNERELTHFFASAEYGFLNLGLGTAVSAEEILQAFAGLVENYPSRQYMSGLMAKSDLASGRKRALKLINDIVEQV